MEENAGTGELKELEEIEGASMCDLITPLAIKRTLAQNFLPIKSI